MITVAIAGTTPHTVACAQALQEDDRFSVQWVLTPDKKLVGRKKVLTSSPLSIWAQEHSLPVVVIPKKIDSKVRRSIESLLEKQPIPDILLVVDFGYIVPKWLLEMPTIAPLNIHPSKLPNWRGSSPGQFSLLFGDRESAVTLMKMDELLDHGPVISQLPFSVQAHWTQQDYYQHSFSLMTGVLAEHIAAFVAGQKDAIDQTDASPTPTARQLSRDDAFIPWTVIDRLLFERKEPLTQQELRNLVAQLNPLLNTAFEARASHSQNALVHTLTAASRAFYPWPGVWSELPLVEGEKMKKRIKILAVSSHTHEGTEYLQLEKVQISGKKIQPWSDVRI